MNGLTCTRTRVDGAQSSSASDASSTWSMAYMLGYTEKKIINGGTPAPTVAPTAALTAAPTLARTYTITNAGQHLDNGSIEYTKYGAAMYTYCCCFCFPCFSSFLRFRTFRRGCVVVSIATLRRHRGLLDVASQAHSVKIGRI